MRSGSAKTQERKLFLDELLLFAGGKGRFLVEHALLAVAGVDDVVNRRRLHVERQVEEVGAVGAGGAVLGGRGDRFQGGVVGVDAPHRVFGEMPDLDRGRLDMEQIGGESLDVAFGNPRRAEIGVDVAGQHVLRLHVAQGL